MVTAVRFVHLLSISLWIGMTVFFTFFAAPSIFKVLPREAAGDVIGAIFPKYWIIGYTCGVLSVATLLFLSFIDRSYPLLRIFLLVLMTVVTFYSGLVVSSRARELKAQIRVVENKLTKEVMQKEFRRQHFRSAVLNMIVIVSGVLYILLMSRELRV